MLNVSKGDMYPWITHTWNTIKGECPHGCSYCYMHRFGKQRPVRFDQKEMKTILGHGNFIFVGSSCDMWAKDIPDAWISETLGECCRWCLNAYLFQSKNPERFRDWQEAMPPGSTLCTTIETNRWYPDRMVKAPFPWVRADAMASLQAFKRYVTIEPIMDFDLLEMVELIERCEPEQVNIGADTGNNSLPEPPADKILELVERLKTFTTIAQKRNLGRLLK